MKNYYQEFLACLLRADRSAAVAIVRRALDAGCEPADLLLGIVQPSMNEVGKLWSRRQASLTQYFVAGKIADDVTDAILPLLECRGAPAAGGRVVIGTIAGDHHGLGRKIVAAFLRAGGLYVRDLGLSVEPAQFVAAALEEKADVIGVSALMARGVEQIKDIRPLLAEKGAAHVRIVVGGAPFSYDRHLYRRVGADAMAASAGEAVQVVRGLLVETGAR